MQSTVRSGSTAQHSTAQHSTAQHSAAQRSAAQHSTVQGSTAQPSTAQGSAVLQSLKHKVRRREVDLQQTGDGTQQDAKEQHSCDLGHQHHGALSIGDGQDVSKPNGRDCCQ